MLCSDMVTSVVSSKWKEIYNKIQNVSLTKIYTLHMKVQPIQVTVKASKIVNSRKIKNNQNNFR